MVQLLRQALRQLLKQAEFACTRRSSVHSKMERRKGERTVRAGLPLELLPGALPEWRHSGVLLDPVHRLQLSCGALESGRGKASRKRETRTSLSTSSTIARSLSCSIVS